MNNRLLYRKLEKISVRYYSDVLEEAEIRIIELVEIYLFDKQIDKN
ncbi:hypothetical protein CAPN002_24710 [Capnocytophaga stomatis]|nr:hypothetical protein CAPN002_24710 [Capnocytophaga stomatis]GIM50507.1 hypothetical protein CAPN003_19590 [Capnocytophaga stomatis]